MKKNSLKEQLDELSEYDDDEVVEYYPFDPEEKDYTFLELLAGIAVVAVIVALVIFFFTENKLYNLTGFGVGVLLAFFVVSHINYTAGRAVQLLSTQVKSYVIRCYIFRLFVVGVAMVAAFALGIGHMLFILLGIMTLKVSVYMHPVTDIVFKKIFVKGGRECDRK